MDLSLSIERCGAFLLFFARGSIFLVEAPKAAIESHAGQTMETFSTSTTAVQS
jgi:hypothetical protein